MPINFLHSDLPLTSLLIDLALKDKYAVLLLIVST